MPSKHKHWKDGHRIKQLKCKSGHSECSAGHYTAFSLNDHRERPIWEVQWWPCRQEDAIAYMKRKHGYIYRPGPGEDREKSQDKPQGHKQSKKSSNPRVPSLSQQNTAAAQAPGAYQNAPAQAAPRQQTRHHQMQPPTFPTGDYMHMDLSQQQKKSSRKEAWMAGNMASNPNMAVHQSAAVAQNMGPMMPTPQALHHGQEQQQGPHRRHRSSHRPKPEQGLQPPVPMMPDASAFPAVALAPGQAPGQAPGPVPMVSPLHATPDAQRQRLRHPHKSSREPGREPGPEPELGEDTQPPSDFPPNCMLASMAAMARAAGPEMHNMALRPRPQPSMSVPPLALPIGMPMPPATTPPRPTRNLASRSARQKTPGIPGPLSLQFPMGEPPAEGVIATQEFPINIGPIDTTMASGPSQNMPMRLPSTQQEAVGMPLAPLKPIPAPLTQKNLTRLQRAQPPRGILKPPGSPGVPGPQRPPVLPTGGGGEPTPAVVVMPPDPRMQPPPTSMPAFPGTPPPALGGPVPPPAPTPPQIVSPPGTPLPPQHRRGHMR